MSPEPGFGSLPRPTLREIVGVPLRLQTYRNLLYLVLAFPLGMVYFLFLAIGLSVGVGLAITIVGVPIVLAVLAIATGLGTVERKLTTLLLGIDIQPPAESPLTLGGEQSLRERVTTLVTAGRTWKAVAYLGTKVVFGLVAFVAVMALLVTSMTLLFVPFVYDQPNVYVGLALEEPATLHPALSYGWEGLLVGVRAAVDVTSWQVSTLPEALLVALLGCGLIVVALNVLNGLAWISGAYARLMLGDGRLTEPAGG